MPQARVQRIATAAPDDVSGLMALIAKNEVNPSSILAILGKTEGNGCVNDFTRAFPVVSLKQALSAHLNPEQAGQVACVMSGGTEGALSPHILVLERVEAEGVGPALALGRCISADILPEDIGTATQIDVVADGVRAAMDQAGITSPGDVHFVQIKCPLLTAERIAEASSRGHATATTDTLKSMGLSRGASALGVALAIDELDRATILRARIGFDTGPWSSRASTSAGVELMGHEIVVMGMSDSWSGNLAIDQAVMADGIDIEPVREALHRLGIAATGQLISSEQTRLVALLAKAEPGTTGQLRGRRPPCWTTAISAPRATPAPL